MLRLATPSLALHKPPLNVVLGGIASFFPFHAAMCDYWFLRELQWCYLFMGIGELLDQIRAYYLDRFQDEILIYQRAPQTQVFVEAVILDASGAPARSGTLDLPMRLDLVTVTEGTADQSVAIDTEGMLGFAPISFDWSDHLRVHLKPFQWNSCPVELTSDRDFGELAPLVSWFEKWFNEREKSDKPFFGVLHALSDPVLESGGNSLEFDVDFGSAPVEALEELVDACQMVGATAVSIGIDS